MLIRYSTVFVHDTRSTKSVYFRFCIICGDVLPAQLRGPCCEWIPQNIQECAPQVCLIVLLQCSRKTGESCRGRALLRPSCISASHQIYLLHVV